MKVLERKSEEDEDKATEEHGLVLGTSSSDSYSFLDYILIMKYKLDWSNNQNFNINHTK